MSCSESIIKTCNEIFELKDNGYSMCKLHIYIYSIIGENMITHKNCNNCQFYLITELINNLYDKYHKNNYDQYDLLNLIWNKCEIVLNKNVNKMGSF